MRKIDKFACDLCALGGIAKVRRKNASLLIVRTTLSMCILADPKLDDFRHGSSFCLRWFGRI